MDGNIIEWNKYFDHIYCIHNISTNNFDNIYSELLRVGILNSNIFSWKITTDKLLNYIEYSLQYSNQKYEDNIIQNKSIDLIKNNLDIFEEAKLLKYNKILIIEDDVCFLNNLHEIKNILDHLPNEYDICHFDWTYYFHYVNQANEYIYPNIFDLGKINDYYTFSIGSYLTSCNAYSLNAINRLINEIDNKYLKNNICIPIDDIILNVININHYPIYKYFNTNEEYINNILNSDLLKNINCNKRLCIQKILNTSINKQVFNKNIDSVYFNDNDNFFLPDDYKLKFDEYNL